MLGQPTVGSKVVYVAVGKQSDNMSISTYNASHRLAVGTFKGFLALSSAATHSRISKLPSAGIGVIRSPIMRVTLPIGLPSVSTSFPTTVVQRAQLVLLAARRMANTAIAKEGVPESMKARRRAGVTQR